MKWGRGVWLKKFLTLGITTSIGLNLVPLSTKAATEYTGQYLVLGVGDYANTTTNDLDNGDAYTFVNRMNGLSWTKYAEFYDDGVYYSDMNSYGNYSDILYFTGHGGSDGKLILQDYWQSVSLQNPYQSWINYNQTGGPMLGYNDTPNEDLEWMIFAACDALTQSNWGSQLKNGVHHILGYRKPSYDIIDNDILNNFINRAFGKNGYMAETVKSAWINANRMYSEPDWAIIGHNGNVNDYMHGVSTGATEDILGTSDLYRWYGDSSGNPYFSDYLGNLVKGINDSSLETTSEEREKINKHYKVKFKVKPEKVNTKAILHSLLGEEFSKSKNSDFNSDVFSSAKGTFEEFEDHSFVFSREIRETSELTKNSEQVLYEIKQFIDRNGGMREDLILKSLIPSIQEQADGTIIVIGYTAEFVQKLEDSYLDGEGSTAITIGYDQEGVNFYKRNVKDIFEKINFNDKELKKMEDAFEIAKEKANVHFKSTDKINFTNAEVVFFSAPLGLGVEKDEIVPAYKFSVDTNNSIYIDAVTGQQLNGGMMLKEKYEKSNSGKYKVPTLEEMLKQKEYLDAQQRGER